MITLMASRIKLKFMHCIVYELNGLYITSLRSFKLQKVLKFFCFKRVSILRIHSLFSFSGDC